MYGGVVRLLVCYLMPDDEEANLARVWELIQAAYDDFRVPRKLRYSNIKLTMFRATKGGSAKLKGKAAEIKDFGPVMVELWKNT